MRRLSVPILAAALLAAVPAGASGATFKGRTSQGRTATVVTDSRNRPIRMVIGWRGPCDNVRTPYRGATRFTPVPGWTTTRLAGSGKYVDKDPGGIRSTNSVEFAGRRTSSVSWRGTFKASVVVRRSGKVIDRCRTGKVTWTASR